MRISAHGPAWRSRCSDLPVASSCPPARAGHPFPSGVTSEPPLSIGRSPARPCHPHLAPLGTCTPGRSLFPGVSSPPPATPARPSSSVPSAGQRPRLRMGEGRALKLVDSVRPVCGVFPGGFWMGTGRAGLRPPASGTTGAGKHHPSVLGWICLVLRGLWVIGPSRERKHACPLSPGTAARVP